jgi:hypothetical protein
LRSAVLVPTGERDLPLYSPELDGPPQTLHLVFRDRALTPAQGQDVHPPNKEEQEAVRDTVPELLFGEVFEELALRHVAEDGDVRTRRLLGAVLRHALQGLVIPGITGDHRQGVAVALHHRQWRCELGFGDEQTLVGDSGVNDFKAVFGLFVERIPNAVDSPSPLDKPDSRQVSAHSGAASFMSASVLPWEVPFLPAEVGPTKTGHALQ